MPGREKLYSAIWDMCWKFLYNAVSRKADRDRLSHSGGWLVSRDAPETSSSLSSSKSLDQPPWLARQSAFLFGRKVSLDLLSVSEVINRSGQANP